jgi:hypothetical protein
MLRAMFRLTGVLIFLTAGALAAQRLPRVDLHAHIHGEGENAKSLQPAEVTALAKKLNVRFGVLAEGGCRGDIHDDQSLSEFIASLQNQPVWRGLQVYGFNWQNCLSTSVRDQLDYVAADALVFPDANGKSVWLWLPDVKFADPEDFMNRYVDYNVRVLSQPIQIWANPTYIPESLKSRYNALWTPERMKRVIDAAVKNHVAIEINAHFEIPSAKFIRAAKAAGAKFSFGSNQHVKGIGEIEFCLRRAGECGLTAADIYVPSRPLGK